MPITVEMLGMYRFRLCLSYYGLVSDLAQKLKSHIYICNTDLQICVIALKYIEFQT